MQDYEKLIERLQETRCDETAPCLASWADDAADALEASTRRVKELEEALEPFAAMGRVMETRARVTLGKMPKDSEIVAQSSGEAGVGILTMGHFRDAAALLPDAPGWGGVYRPPFDRTTLAKEEAGK